MVPRDDGISVRVEDFSNAGGVAAVFLSPRFLPGGFNLSGIPGAVWVDPSIRVLIASGPISSVAPELYQANIIPPDSIFVARGTTFVFTALTFGAGGARLSNAQAVAL